MSGNSIYSNILVSRLSSMLQSKLSILMAFCFARCLSRSRFVLPHSVTMTGFATCGKVTSTQIFLFRQRVVILRFWSATSHVVENYSIQFWFSRSCVLHGVSARRRSSHLHVFVGVSDHPHFDGLWCHSQTRYWYVSTEILLCHLLTVADTLCADPQPVSWASSSSPRTGKSPRPLSRTSQWIWLMVCTNNVYIEKHFVFQTYGLHLARFLHKSTTKYQLKWHIIVHFVDVTRKKMPPVSWRAHKFVFWN